MAQHRAQRDPVLRPDAETRPDQVLALRRHAPPEAQLGVADLLVLLEGDVAADHVVEEDAEAPHGQGVAVIPATPDPLGRGVHPSTCREQ